MRLRVGPGVRAALTVPVLLALTACSGGSAPGGSAPGAAVPGADRVTVVQDAGAGTPSVRYSLQCSPPGGTHPRAAAACAHLAGLADPFRPLAADRSCSLLFGGPDRASVTGTWHGRPVDLQLSRTDGCRIAQWQSLGPLLDQPVGPGGG